jgi:hypothetical protein
MRIARLVAVAIAALLVLSSEACSTLLDAAGLAACVPKADDFTLLWWADGFPGRSPDARSLECLRTGEYAMMLDTATMRIAHLAPTTGKLSYADAGMADDRSMAGLTPAELGLTITVDGRKYRCVRGGRFETHSGPRIVESGRFLQRGDVTDLVFEDDQGHPLVTDARFEFVAWPDRLALLLEASPGRKEIAAGPSFGRVGGGHFLDGRSAIDVPASAELEPETLTLELWVYVPDGPSATRNHPWIVCSNGNEWGKGHYGLMLLEGKPTATLDIGGGRENAYTVSASNAPLRREQWHHLAMSYDGQVLRLYVGGKQQGAREVNRKRIPGSGALAIGRRQDGFDDGYHFRGVIDEVRLYRRALSAEEIAAHAARPEEVRPDPSLVRQWTFDPKGPAAMRRPGLEWTNASMEIGLQTGGKTFSDRAATSPGEVWRTGTRKSVAIALRPTAAGMVQATEPDGIAVTAAAIPAGGPCPVTYDRVRGWHCVNLDRIEPQGKQNDVMERVRVRVENREDQEQPVRLLFEKNDSGIRVPWGSPITGVSPMLRDVEGHPLGIAVQISKNWHSQPDRDLIYQGCWFHGFTLLRVPPRSTVEFEFTLVYAHWGGVAAASHAQLCLIGWGSNQLWNQSALGAWGESICYEPDQAQAQATVLDVRPLMVHSMNQDTPVQWTWTNNVGGADFFRCFDAAGRRQFPKGMKTTYHRYGPNLTEVTYAGGTGEGQLEHHATVSLYRSDDINRGVYRVRMDVRRPMEFQRFVFFQVGADTYNYTAERKMALGNESGLLREWSGQWGGGRYKTGPLACIGRVPWISMHEAVSHDSSKAGAWANRGIVIRRWDAMLGGKRAEPWVAEYGVRIGEDTSLIDIVPPPDVKKLLPGDYLEATFEHIIMPQSARDYYGPNANLRSALEKDGNTWRMIAREAMGNDLGIDVQEGTLRQTWPIRIQATEGNRAAFRMTGGLGYVPVTIAGLSGYRRPTLEIQQGDGSWRVVDQSIHGNDFWQTDYDPATGAWEITYTLAADTRGDARAGRAYRFRLENQ